MKRSVTWLLWVAALLLASSPVLAQPKQVGKALPGASAKGKGKKKVKEAAKAEPSVPFRQTTSLEVRKTFEAAGWTVVSEPIVQDQPGLLGVVYPVVQGAAGGSVSVHEFADEYAADIFRKTMREKGADVALDGSRALAVLMPTDQAAGRTLFVLLERSSGGKPAGAQADAAAQGEAPDVSAVVSRLTPKELRRRMVAEGWTILEDSISDQKMEGVMGTTLPVVRGNVGGAVSLYTYDEPSTAQLFQDAMQKQGAQTGRSQGRVLTVLMPGNDEIAAEVFGALIGDAPAAAAQEEDDEEGVVLEVEADHPPRIGVRALSNEELRRRLEAGGWTVLGDPQPSDSPTMRGYTLPIVKGSRGGAASIYEYSDPGAAQSFESSMVRQGAAARREGGKVVTVLFPGDADAGQRLMRWLLGETLTF